MARLILHIKTKPWLNPKTGPDLITDTGIVKIMLLGNGIMTAFFMRGTLLLQAFTLLNIFGTTCVG